MGDARVRSAQIVAKQTWAAGRYGAVLSVWRVIRPGPSACLPETYLWRLEVESAFPGSGVPRGRFADFEASRAPFRVEAEPRLPARPTQSPLRVEGRAAYQSLAIWCSVVFTLWTSRNTNSPRATYQAKLRTFSPFGGTYTDRRLPGYRITLMQPVCVESSGPDPFGLRTSTTSTIRWSLSTEAK